MARPTQPKDEYPTRIYHLDKDEFGSRETEVFPPSKIIPQMNYDVVMHELVLRQSMLHHEYEMNMKYQTALHNHSKMAMNYQACDIAPMTYTTNQGYASMQTWDMSQSQQHDVSRIDENIFSRTNRSPKTTQHMNMNSQEPYIYVNHIKTENHDHQAYSWKLKENVEEGSGSTSGSKLNNFAIHRVPFETGIQRENQENTDQVEMYDCVQVSENTSKRRRTASAARRQYSGEYGHMLSIYSDDQIRNQPSQWFDSNASKCEKVKCEKIEFKSLTSDKKPKVAGSGSKMGPRETVSQQTKEAIQASLLARGYEIVHLARGGFKRRRASATQWQYCCDHGRIRSRCVPCGGAYICAHGRERNRCKECGGVSICEHGRERFKCKPCGGSSICTHGRRAHRCNDCRSVSKTKVQRPKFLRTKCISTN